MEKDSKPEGCSSNCESCGLNCSSRNNGPASASDFRVPLAEGCSVKKLIGIASGKGGVGKSLVTSLIASGIRRRGYKTGILDADITGPSIPKAFGLTNDGVSITEDGKLMIPEKSEGGVEIISTNLLLENETDPIIWRGSLLAGAIKQFWQEVLWKDMDFVFVDMPPGTGDITLTVFQSLPLDGIIVVTSPQDMVSMIVEKEINMASKMDIPIIGIVENMSYMLCQNCGGKLYPFGESHIDEVAERLKLKVLAKLPIDPVNAQYVDAGAVESIKSKEIEELINVIVG